MASVAQQSCWSFVFGAFPVQYHEFRLLLRFAKCAEGRQTSCRIWPSSFIVSSARIPTSFKQIDIVRSSVAPCGAKRALATSGAQRIWFTYVSINTAPVLKVASIADFNWNVLQPFSKFNHCTSAEEGRRPRYHVWHLMVQPVPPVVPVSHVPVLLQ